MGSGNSAVTGELGPTISVGDPVVVMVIMVVLDLAVVFLYWKLLKGVWLEVIRGGHAVAAFLGGCVMGLGGAILGKVSDLGNGNSGLNPSNTGTPAQASGVMGSSKISDSSPASSATQKGSSAVNVRVYGDTRDSGSGTMDRNRGNGLNNDGSKQEDILKKKSKIEEKIKEGADKTTATASKAVDKVGTEAKKAADKVADDVKTVAKLMV